MILIKMYIFLLVTIISFVGCKESKNSPISMLIQQPSLAKSYLIRERKTVDHTKSVTFSDSQLIHLGLKIENTTGNIVYQNTVALSGVSIQLLPGDYYISLSYLAIGIKQGETFLTNHCNSSRSTTNTIENINRTDDSILYSEVYKQKVPVAASLTNSVRISFPDFTLIPIEDYGFVFFDSLGNSSDGYITYHDYISGQTITDPCSTLVSPFESKPFKSTLDSYGRVIDNLPIYTSVNTEHPRSFLIEHIPTTVDTPVIFSAVLSQNDKTTYSPLVKPSFYKFIRRASATYPDVPVAAVMANTESFLKSSETFDGTVNSHTIGNDPPIGTTIGGRMAASRSPLYPDISPYTVTKILTSRVSPYNPYNYKIDFHTDPGVDSYGRSFTVTCSLYKVIYGSTICTRTQVPLTANSDTVTCPNIIANAFSFPLDSSGTSTLNLTNSSSPNYYSTYNYDIGAYIKDSDGFYVTKGTASSPYVYNDSAYTPCQPTILQYGYNTFAVAQ